MKCLAKDVSENLPLINLSEEDTKSADDVNDIKVEENSLTFSQQFLEHLLTIHSLCLHHMQV